MTSIEWLVSKLEWTYSDIDAYSQYVLQAKEMHKEEIQDAYSSGRFDYEDYVKGIKLKVKQSKEYYQQVYDKKNG